MKKASLVELSNGTRIKIDEEEVDKVLEAISSGGVVVLKQGIITNTNYIVGITPDFQRMSEVAEKNYNNKHLIEQGQAKPHELKELEDMNAEIRQKIKKLAQEKRLN